MSGHAAVAKAAAQNAGSSLFHASVMHQIIHEQEKTPSATTPDDVQDANNAAIATSWRQTHESQTRLFEYDASKLTPRMA